MRLESLSCSKLQILHRQLDSFSMTSRYLTEYYLAPTPCMLKRMDNNPTAPLTLCYASCCIQHAYFYLLQTYSTADSLAQQVLVFHSSLAKIEPQNRFGLFIKFGEYWRFWLSSVCMTLMISLLRK